MKKRKPLLYLLIIPAGLILGAVLFIAGSLLDSNIMKGGEGVVGHPAPVFSVITFVIGIIIILASLILAIILMCTGFAKNKKIKQLEKQAAAFESETVAYEQTVNGVETASAASQYTANTAEADNARGKKKIYSEEKIQKIMKAGYCAKPFLFLIILVVQIVIDIILIVGGFKLDQMNYNPGEQAGFMVPVTMFMGMGVAILMTVIMGAISLVLTFVNFSRRKKQKKAVEKQLAEES